MPSRKLTVDMDGILDAMPQSSQDPYDWYLDLQEGRIVFVDDDLTEDVDDDPVQRALEQEPDRYAEIPRVQSQEEYELMCRFASSLDEDDLREKLELALRGRGAFGRFRDVVFSYPDLSVKWFGLRQRALLERARSWFEEIGIEPVYTLRPLEPPAAARGTPPEPRSKVDLLDVLLLGAPEGKTELVDGRVLRQVRSKSPSEARSMFKSLARQLCDHYGLGWRNRFIASKSEFHIERAHLRIEGQRVELWVDVSHAAWRAFG